jgi:hypothetical protein
VRDDLLLGQLRAGRQLDERRGYLAVPLVGDADHLGDADRRVGLEMRGDLDGGHVLPAHLEHVLEPPQVAQPAVGAELAEVTAVVPGSWPASSWPPASSSAEPGAGPARRNWFATQYEAWGEWAP